MRVRLFVPLLPLAAFFMISACTAAKPAGPTDARILLDSALRLDLQSVQVLRNGSGTLEVQVVLANNSGHEHQAQYKLEWLDDNGTYSTSILSRWMPIRLSLGAPSHIQGTAPNPSISDFRLQVRRNLAEGYE